jgi:predicted RecB family nuclease
MKLTSALFEAYLKCPTKCYLRSTGQTGVGNAYADWVREQNDAYRKEGVQRLVAVTECEVAVTTPGAENLKTATWRLAVDMPLETETMASRLHAVERVPSQGRGRPAQFTPVRFVFFNKLTKDDRLLVAFDALVLSEILGREVGMAKIIHGDNNATLKVKVASLLATVRKLTAKMSAMLSAGSPPDLILNRHCGQCEFRDGCRQKALEKDELSLLGGMSAKERQKLRSKGIFTVTQLSYTFRPRRQSKRLRDKREKYHHSLKALAIREKKIHIVGSPELKIEGTPVYLDVEGLPDRDFYYLIGVRIGNGEPAVQHSLWAETVEDEGKIWREFLAILETVEKPVLIHYGSYEATFLKRMKERYKGLRQHPAAAKAIGSALNLLKVIFAQVYFPTYSNSLKEIGALLGVEWQVQLMSGVQSIAWRDMWETSGRQDFKQALLEYNRNDCEAAYILLTELKQIREQTSSARGVGLRNLGDRDVTEQGAETHRVFQSILKSAHAGYQQSRIKLRSLLTGNTDFVPKGHRVSPVRARNYPSIRGTVIKVPRKRVCHQHPGQELRPQREIIEHKLIDLVFTKGGCRKTIARFVGRRALCPKCGRAFLPPAITRLRGRIFGRGFQAWVVYERVALRMPFDSIALLARDVFSEDVNSVTLINFLNQFASEYGSTEKRLLERMLGSSVIHVDETKISITGTDHYVWVLTDGEHVVFRLTATRETTWIHRLLEGYQGTLVSDFYGGYDGIRCRQQKCLVHLIRDLNDDLWKNPFDSDYESFVVAVRNLLIPIFCDIDRFDLKARHLRKHMKEVRRFYEFNVCGPETRGEITATYQKRFIRYRASMFTFLENDGVPWNNNAAERALRHLAIQRKISGSFFAAGAERYLRLLGIAQSCRFQSKSFLRFLLSGSHDVDIYKESPRRRRRRSPTSEPKALPADESTQK